MKNTFGWSHDSEIAEGFERRGWNGLDGFLVYWILCGLSAWFEGLAQRNKGRDPPGSYRNCKYEAAPWWDIDYPPVSLQKPAKTIIISSKNIEKHILTENIPYLVGGGRGGVPQLSEKRKVSVGTLSTFRHPLDQLCTFAA
jgi:hypothetical protein